MAFYVVRPQVLVRVPNSDEVVALNFGTKLWFIDEPNEEYVHVRDCSGIEYLIRKPYVYYANYQLLSIDSEGVCLSPIESIKENEYGFCAGGMRYDEDAIIIFETQASYYIVTSEGFSGFIPNDSSHVTIK